MIVSGSLEADVLRVESYEIHGQPNRRLFLRPDGFPEGKHLEAYLAAEAVYDDPRAGDRVVAEIVLGQVVQVRRVEGPGSLETDAPAE